MKVARTVRGGSNGTPSYMNKVQQSWYVSKINFVAGGITCLTLLIVSIGVTVVFWFILTRLLNIYLEPGILFRWLELN